MADHCTNHHTSTQSIGLGRGTPCWAPRCSDTSTADSRIVLGHVTIDVLPDKVLLVIFDFCMLSYKLESIIFGHRWVRLLHMCQRWRSVVLSAPVRLDLKIMYNCRTLIREMLDIWPAVPITIWASRLRGEIEENCYGLFRSIVLSLLTQTYPRRVSNYSRIICTTGPFIPLVYSHARTCKRLSDLSVI